MSVQVAPKITSSSQPNRRAVAHLFEEYDRARAERDAAERRLARFAETIRLLIGTMPARDRAELEAKFLEVQGFTPNEGRGTEVYNNVVALFAKSPKTELSLPEVQRALEENGLDVDPKAVSNAVSYLARNGKLIRVSRGKYVVRNEGFGIEADGFEDGTNRLTEHDV